MENNQSNNQLDKQVALEKQKQKIQEEMYQMVMRQTTYNYEETKEKLKEHNNNYVKVIQEYLGKQNTAIEPKTVNQKIYKEIRSFMDYGAEKYEQRKKQQEQMQKFRENLIEEAKRRGLDKNTSQSNDK